MVATRSAPVGVSFCFLLTHKSNGGSAVWLESIHHCTGGKREERRDLFVRYEFGPRRRRNGPLSQLSMAARHRHPRLSLIGHGRSLERPSITWNAILFPLFFPIESSVAVMVHRGGSSGIRSRRNKTSKSSIRSWKSSFCAKLYLVLVQSTFVSSPVLVFIDSHSRFIDLVGVVGLRSDICLTLKAAFPPIMGLQNRFTE